MDVDDLFKEIVDNLEDKKYNIKIPKIKNKKDKNKILNNVALIRDTLKHNYLKYRKKPSGKVLSDGETKFIVKYEEEFGDMGNVFKTGEIKKAMSMLDRYQKKFKK